MQNEILKPVLDTDEVAVPRYDIVGPNGSVIQQNVELRLKNEVVQAGTPYDEESVLPASLREQLELPQSATPAEAMAALLTKGGGAVRRNRPPLTTDPAQVGKLWVVPEMFFNNLMPNALTQVAGNWQSSNATVAVSGNAATLTGNGTENSVYAQAGMLSNAKAGDKIFVQATVKVNHDANTATVQLTCGEQTLATKTLDVPAAGDTMLLQAVATVEASGSLVLRLHSTYNTAAVQSGKSLTVSAITVWNLTEDMCEAQEGNEFTEQEAANYISSFGQFQTKEYEYSTWWWGLRGVTDGVYLWARLFDEATTAEAQAGTVGTSWLSPRRAQEFLTARLATTAEAKAGTPDTKWMSPLKVQQHFDAKAASDAEVAAGTNTTKWTNPKQVLEASKTVMDSSTGKIGPVRFRPGAADYTRYTTSYGSSSARPHANSVWVHPDLNKIACAGFTANADNAFTGSVMLFDSDTNQYTTQVSLSSVSRDYVSEINWNRYAVCSMDGQVMCAYVYNDYYLFDINLNKKSASISPSNFNGGWNTSSSWGYFYASKNNAHTLYYASRGGTSWSSLSLGLTNYSSYEYFAPAGSVGEVLYFVYLSSSNVMSLGKVNLSTKAVTLGISSVTGPTNLNYKYVLPLQTGKVIIGGQNTGYTILDLATETLTWSTAVKSYDKCQLHNQFYIGSDPDYAYYWSDDTSTYNVLAFSRATGQFSHVFPIHPGRYGFNSMSKSTEAVFEKGAPIIGYGCYLLPNQGLLSTVTGPISTYTSNSGVYIPQNSSPAIYTGKNCTATWLGIVYSHWDAHTYKMYLDMLTAPFVSEVAQHET